jgi:hypothetical protein
MMCVGVGQNEQPFADVRPADLCRRDDASCNAIAQALKVAGDVLDAEGQMAGDILEKAPLRRDLADDPRDLGPEVARIVPAAPLSGKGEGLAGITGKDAMNAATPRAAVKGSQVVPDRSRSQGRVRHPGHEDRRREGAPLDETHSAVSGFGQVQAKVESADTGAKAEAAKLVMSSGGMNSHKSCPFRRGLAAWVKGSGVASGC